MRLTRGLCVIACLAAVSTSALAAFDLLPKLTDPVRDPDGKVIDVEALRKKIRAIDDHLTETDRSGIIIFPDRITERFEDRLIAACDVGDFPDLKNGIHLQDTHRETLAQCMKGVFAFADAHFDFAAPGLYRRFSAAYIDQAIDLAFRCSHSTKRPFVYFSLSAWLVHPGELAEMDDFLCNERPQVHQRFHASDLNWNPGRIPDELFYYYSIFGNWADVQRYRFYLSVYSANFDLYVCTYITSPNPIDNNNNLIALDDLILIFRENRCWRFNFSEPSR